VKVVMIVIHIAVGLGLIWMALRQMSKNVELGGAFGGGAAYAHFGRKKGLDTGGKITAALGVAFFITSLLTAFVLK